jgi:hypothetical protein
MNNQKNVHGSGTIFVGLNIFIEKKSESKTDAGKNKSKIYLYIDTRDAVV